MYIPNLLHRCITTDLKNSHFYHRLPPHHHFSSILTSSDHLSCSWLWSFPFYGFLLFSLYIKLRHFIGHAVLNYFLVPHLLPASFVIYHVASCVTFLLTLSFFQMLHNLQKACSVQFTLAYTCPFVIIPFLLTLSISHRKGSIWVTYFWIIQDSLAGTKNFLLTDWLSQTILKTHLSPVI